MDGRFPHNPQRRLNGLPVLNPDDPDLIIARLQDPEHPQTRVVMEEHQIFGRCLLLGQHVGHAMETIRTGDGERDEARMAGLYDSYRMVFTAIELANLLHGESTIRPMVLPESITRLEEMLGTNADDVKHVGEALLEAHPEYEGLVDDYFGVRHEAMRKGGAEDGELFDYGVGFNTGAAYALMLLEISGDLIDLAQIDEIPAPHDL